MKRVVFLLFLAVNMYSWYGDIGIVAIPSYVIMNTSENTLYGYGIYTFDVRGRVFLSRFHYADTVFRDTLIAGTNMTNLWELKRLSWHSGNEYSEENLSWSVTLGRERFSLDEGKLFEKPGDGLGFLLALKGWRGETVLSYRGWTEFVQTNRTYSSKTNERLEGGVLVSFPLWFFSFVRVGVAGSVDLRTNNRTTLWVISSSLQGNIGSFFSYQGRGWYEMGEIALTNSERSDPVSAWAGEIQLFVGKRDFPLQGSIRWLGASGENDSGGWNRFTGLGSVEGPVVLLHPVANLSMGQIRLTWRGFHERLLVSVVDGLLWRMETKDLVLAPLYGSGAFLGHELGLETVYRFDPNFTLFLKGGVFFKGDAFAVMKDKPLYQIATGIAMTL
ncbi:hypothetical protein [Thermospira aquatica]|uniref:Alginate export domain-containing protein n=1 Tax=Thermospira aquatica TaxID=2828656 RepID=A0AAX3BFW0_9SPIR|nr:hypothetical protein [Thermospira aquatica]URA11248.1 hypothetical protein KDW03_05480 [Thermospira aquatica]